jgi:hypothetical protein
MLHIIEWEDDRELRIGKRSQPTLRYYLSYNFPGGTVEDRAPQSEWPVCGPRIEPGTSTERKCSAKRRTIDKS